MREELTESLNRLEILLKQLSKKYKDHSEENAQLHGLVSAMETDTKKAGRLINEHERAIREKERVREKIAELLEKFENLRI